MEDKKLSIRLLIIAIIITLMLTIINFNILNKYSNNTISIIFPIFVFSYSISLLLMKPIEKIFEKIYIKNNEKNIEIMDFNYYREIIKGYSIGVIIKCYGKKVNYKEQLVAIMLKLILMKKIRIHNNKVEVIDQDGLAPSEKMFIRACQDFKIYKKKYIKNQLEEDFRMDAIQTDLFSKEETSTSKLNEKMFRFGLMLWTINIFSMIFLHHKYNELFIFIAWLSNMLVIIFMIIGKERKIMYRTEKGKEIQNKIIGLEQFLKDYSNINEKMIEEINLWEDYIIYAIIFDMKGKLNKEAYDMYKKIEKICFE